MQGGEPRHIAGVGCDEPSLIHQGCGMFLTEGSHGSLFIGIR